MTRRFAHPVRAVTFDVGGTLLEVDPSVGHVYAAVAREHGIIADPHQLNTRFRAAWKQLQDFRHTRGQWAALVDAAFGPEVQPAPSASFFDALYERFSEASAWRLRAGAHGIFKSLAKSGVKLGIISNWDERLRLLLNRFDLERWFDVVVISCEVEFTKPDPRIFACAARQLEIEPRHIVHVGDSIEMDAQGAINAGFQAVVIGAGQGTANCPRITDLNDLWACLQMSGEQPSAL